MYIENFDLHLVIYEVLEALFPGNISQNGTHGVQRHPETSEDGPVWYFTRKEIEENSPSKRDGIDWKTEANLRNSYCSCLQDLGMRLELPQVTIATATIFCQRFFLYHSLGRNDWRVIATACMFLAGKVEDTPRPLEDVILVSYEIMNKEDPVADQRIKQKDVYEQQQELILAGEMIVLQSLAFDLNLRHPYKPLMDAIKKFRVDQKALAQVAWNFVNDGLRTSLCLQFQPHHIAAGAIFLAAKFLKVKLASDGELWWQAFDVTPQQLEEVSNQMLELYEQNKEPPSNAVEGTKERGAHGLAGAEVPTRNGENANTNSNSKTGLEPSANHVKHPASNQGRSRDSGATEVKHMVEDEAKGNNYHIEGKIVPQDKENLQEAQEMLRSRSGYGEEKESNARRNEMRDSTFGRSPQEVIKEGDGDRVKAAPEKRRKASGHVTKKTEVMDDDYLIEREPEDGIELAAAQTERNKQDRRQNWSEPSDRSENGNVLPSSEPDVSTVEGEESAVGDIDPGLQSPKSGYRKRKASTNFHFDCMED